MINTLTITKSRIRQKLLSYFFTNPDSALYLREAASILKEDPGNLSKEFSRLEKEKIFISSKRGNQKHFSINKEHPLYSELKAIIFKTIGVKGRLKDIIASSDGIILAFIYGSFAASKENSASDIDLLIVGKPNEDSLMQKIEDLEKILKREISYNVYSKEEFTRRLAKKDSFLENLLKRPKIILKGRLNAVR